MLNKNLIEKHYPGMILISAIQQTKCIYWEGVVSYFVLINTDSRLQPSNAKNLPLCNARVNISCTVGGKKEQNDIICLPSQSKLIYAEYFICKERNTLLTGG